MVKRQIAYITNVRDLIDGEYVKVEGEWEPNFVNVGDRRVSRVNLIATIVSVQASPDLNYDQVVIDDGTGSISVRTFNDRDILKALEIGDIVLLIGRPREFGSEKYIIPEIVKKIYNSKWIEVRKLELERFKRALSKPGVEEEIKEDVEVSETEQVYNLIKKLDFGNGADYETVIAKSNIVDADKIIDTLMKHGEVFETRPGKLKVLE